MNIYFIRHANPDYATDSITELGKEQAQKLSDATKSWKIDEVYQSSMGRAQQTTAYCLKNWNLKPETKDWLKELCWGDTKGDAYASDSPWTINDRLIETTHSYPQGESWKTIPELQQDRLIQDIETRCQAFDDFLKEQGYIRKGQLYNAENPNSKNIAFFCHGGLSSALIAHALNIPFWQFIAHTGLQVTSISKISFSETKGSFETAKLAYLNDAKHLGIY